MPEVATRRHSQFNILNLLMATVLCAVFLAWWKTSSSLRDTQSQLDTMLRPRQVTPTPEGYWIQPQVLDKQDISPDEFLTVLRTGNSDEFDDMANSFAGSDVADESISMLLELTVDNDAGIRARALSTLGRMHRHADVVVPGFIAQLSSEDVGIRWYAITALGNLKGHARAAVPTLMEQLEDDNSPTAVSAAVALRQIAPEIPTEARLIELLPTQTGHNRNRAIDALADLGTSPARDALVRAFKTEKDSELRSQIGHAIKRVDTSTALPVAEPTNAAKRLATEMPAP